MDWNSVWYILKFQLGAIFPLVDSYNKSVLEAYGFYNENAEPNLTEASCVSVDIITVLKPPGQEDQKSWVNRRKKTEMYIKKCKPEKNIRTNMCFQHCSLTFWIICGNDLGCCLYNRVKLVSYFSHCISLASLCSILKIHQHISQLQGTCLCWHACYEIGWVDQNLKAWILRVFCDVCSEKTKPGNPQHAPKRWISTTFHITHISS